MLLACTTSGASSITMRRAERMTETPSQRMRAIVQTEYGTADVLRVAEIERPVIGADEVLVKVRAVGLTGALGI